MVTPIKLYGYDECFNICFEEKKCVGYEILNDYWCRFYIGNLFNNLSLSFNNVWFLKNCFYFFNCLVGDVESENSFSDSQKAEAKILKGRRDDAKKVARVTLSYHTKVYENISSHIDCYNNCLKTKSFKCVASEMYNGECYLFDRNLKMSYYTGANVYFGNNYFN